MAPHHAHPSPTTSRPGDQTIYQEALDPANQSLADALRRSFSVLKLIMLVLLVLYFFSGFFRVNPNEVGLRWRYGRIVGAEQNTTEAILTSGWHWSWPYPVERFTTYSTSEREIPVEFLFQFSEAEKTGGIKGYRYDALSPARDDYLITGDVNIIHASLAVKYRLKDKDADDNIVHYVRNVTPQPSPEAGVRSEKYHHYPEYQLMVNLVRDAVIEIAARGEALKIRGDEQQQFLTSVARRVTGKLNEYREAGLPLGIYVDPDQGIIGKKTGEVEPIMPPRQTQEVFDLVQAVGEQRGSAIIKANAEAQVQLVNTAGPDYRLLAKAIDLEYQAMATLSATESVTAGADNTAAIAKLRTELLDRRKETEQLLTAASGSVRETVRNAEISRDRIIKEAAGDYQRFQAILPEYQRDPAIFLARMLAETYANALDNPQISKIYLPADCREWRISIPRTGKAVVETKEEKERKQREAAARSSSPTPVMP